MKKNDIEVCHVGRKKVKDRYYPIIFLPVSSSFVFGDSVQVKRVNDKRSVSEVIFERFMCLDSKSYKKVPDSVKAFICGKSDAWFYKKLADFKQNKS